MGCNFNNKLSLTKLWSFTGFLKSDISLVLSTICIRLGPDGHHGVLQAPTKSNVPSEWY